MKRYDWITSSAPQEAIVTPEGYDILLALRYALYEFKKKHAFDASSAAMHIECYRAVHEAITRADLIRTTGFRKDFKIYGIDIEINNFVPKDQIILNLAHPSQLIYNIK